MTHFEYKCTNNNINIKTGAGQMFANRIREVRTKAGLQQCQLAGEANVAIANLSRWEHGWARPTHATAEKLAKALEVSVEKLFPGETLYRPVSESELGT